MTAQQTAIICHELAAAGAEMRVCSYRLDARRALIDEPSVQRYIKGLPKGSCVVYFAHDAWRVAAALPEGYTGRYWLAGEPFSPRLAQTGQEKMMARSIYADHAKGYKLD